VKIGIIGGGQLARMIIEECNKFAFEFYILSAENNSPAGQITSNEITGDWNDEECLKKFSGICDIITLENEFIDHKKIKFLEETGKAVYPGSHTIKLIQDKLYQKETLEKLDIPVSKFCRVDSAEDIANFAEKNNYPLILKSRTMGYDGKGNIEIKSGNEISKAFGILSERGKLLCESFIDFDKEIATQVVRNRSGEIRIYPVVETIQKDHICKLVIASENLFGNLRQKVEEMAVKIVNELNYVGVLGIEMFLKGDDILVNELAPRVHNSGHYTIEGCYTSQFENHIRAILDLPLGNTELRNDNSVMINIIGERNGEAKLSRAGKIFSMEKVYLHIYGKKETKKGRKMGHITVLRKDLNEAIKIAGEARSDINI
jgi:5-(carboxyamino)imidazole ribonucleotide synthase